MTLARMTAVLRACRRRWLAVLIAGAAVGLLFGLTSPPLQHWDEGTHAAVSLEMVRSGDWLDPTHMGRPYHSKPPLKLWLTAMLYRVLGVDLWAIRLPSALAGIAASVLLGWWVRRATGSRLQGLATGLALATMRPAFRHAFRTGEMDGIAVFAMVASLHAWWEATRRGGRPGPWMAWLGTALGIGVMCKSVAAMLPLLVIAVDVVSARPRLPWRAVVAAVVALTVVAAPWHLWMTAVHGDAFWRQYLGREIAARAAHPLFDPGRGTWWYLQLLPSSPACCPAACCWRRRRGAATAEPCASGCCGRCSPSRRSPSCRPR